MKNIHVLPTDKPSRLWINNLLQGKLELSKEILIGSNTAQNIYITSDEEIKEGDWIKWGEAIYKANRKYIPPFKKIILTTDQDLIADGVQAIDDEFLEWFVKNPNCEFVEVQKWFDGLDFLEYKIIIPQEELKQEYQSECICENSCRGFVNVKCKQLKKQETLEEAAKNWGDKFYGEYDDIREYMASAFVKGAEWQAERMYSEDDLRKAFKHGILFKEESVSTCEEAIEAEFSMLVEQFKKK